jgi:preprotein translocase subunit SecD
LGLVTRGLVVVAVAACVLSACSSSSKRVVVPPVPPPSTPSTPSNLEREALQFREVQGVLPYAGTASTTCQNGRIVAPAASDVPSADVILADRAKKSCYVMGPVLLTGRNVVGAQAVVNDTTAAWEINVHFANDDFVTKVATPETGRQIAIVLDHVVESAPTVNQGITGRDITISGSFDEATARAIAKKLS